MLGLKCLRHIRVKKAETGKFRGWSPGHGENVGLETAFRAAGMDEIDCGKQRPWRQSR